MAIITRDLQIADKPTLDDVKSMLQNGTYGLNALKNEVTTVKSNAQNAASASGKKLKYRGDLYAAPNNTPVTITGNGMALLKAQYLQYSHYRTQITIDGIECAYREALFIYNTDGETDILFNAFHNRRYQSLPIFFKNSLSVVQGDNSGIGGIAMLYWLYE